MKYKIIIGAAVGGIFGAILGYFGKCAGGGCPFMSHPVLAMLFWAFIGGTLASMLSNKSKPRPPENKGNDET